MLGLTFSQIAVGLSLGSLAWGVDHLAIAERRLEEHTASVLRVVLPQPTPSDSLDTTRDPLLARAAFGRAIRRGSS